MVLVGNSWALLLISNYVDIQWGIVLVLQYFIDQFDFKNVASAIPRGLPRAWQKMMQWSRRTPVPELKQYIVWNAHLLSCSWMPPMYGRRSDIMFLKPNWSIVTYQTQMKQNGLYHKVDNIKLESTLNKSNSHKSNNRLSRRPFQVLFSLSFMFYCFLPHMSWIFSKSKVFLQSQWTRLRQSGLYLQSWSVLRTYHRETVFSCTLAILRSISLLHRKLPVDAKHNVKIQIKKDYGQLTADNWVVVKTRGKTKIARHLGRLTWWTAFSATQLQWQ